MKQKITEPKREVNKSKISWRFKHIHIHTHPPSVIKRTKQNAVRINYPYHYQLN